MRRLTTLGTQVVLLTAACFWRGTPVPVSGDFSNFAGEWDGSYASAETGRSGSIIFQLSAGTDSAYGDLLMTPRQNHVMAPMADPHHAPPSELAPHPLRISFVRSEGDRVMGTLEVYPDPETTEPLLTKFEGRLRGNEIKGAYSTYATRSGRTTTGEWSVKRKRG